MTDTAAEAAYRAALDEIARVKREGGTDRAPNSCDSDKGGFF